MKNYFLHCWIPLNFFCLAFLFRFFQSTHYQPGNFILLAFLALIFFLVRKNKTIPFDEAGNHYRPIIFILLLSVFSIYFLLKTNLNLVSNEYADLHIESIDQHLIGGNLSIWLSHVISPWKTDLASFFYLSFFAYSVWALYFYGLRNKNKLLAISFVDFYTSVYFIGFGLYFLIPTAGPYLAMSHAFNIPLERNGISDIEFSIIKAGSSHFDAFPSLHAAITCFLVFSGDALFKPKHLFFSIPLLIGICWSTFYLRYHYLTDVICGFMIAFVGCYLFHKNVQYYSKLNYDA